MEFTNQLMRRFLANAITPEDALWTCPSCGIMTPKKVTLQGETRYLRERCTCQVAEEEAREYAQKRQAWMAWQENRTFTWLGERWEDRALLGKTFDNFDRSMQPDAFNTVRFFVTEMRGTLVLHGTFGTGKTHLLAALCNEIRQAGKGSLFTTSPKLFSAINARIAAREDYSVILDNAMKTNLFVLDDIDKSKHSEFREEVFFEVVDERVKAGRPIAISTNRLSDLANYVGDAVCSRLKTGQIDCQMEGLDFREGLEIA